MDFYPKKKKPLLTTETAESFQTCVRTTSNTKWASLRSYAFKANCIVLDDYDLETSTESPLDSIKGLVERIEENTEVTGTWSDNGQTTQTVEKRENRPDDECPVKRARKSQKHILDKRPISRVDISSKKVYGQTVRAKKRRLGVLEHSQTASSDQIIKGAKKRKLSVSDHLQTGPPIKLKISFDRIKQLGSNKKIINQSATVRIKSKDDIGKKLIIKTRRKKPKLDPLVIALKNIKKDQSPEKRHQRKMQRRRKAETERVKKLKSESERTNEKDDENGVEGDENGDSNNHNPIEKTKRNLFKTKKSENLASRKKGKKETAIGTTKRNLFKTNESKVLLERKIEIEGLQSKQSEKEGNGYSSTQSVQKQSRRLPSLGRVHNTRFKGSKSVIPAIMKSPKKDVLSKVKKYVNKNLTVSSVNEDVNAEKSPSVNKTSSVVNVIAVEESEPKVKKRRRKRTEPLPIIRPRQPENSSNIASNFSGDSEDESNPDSGLETLQICEEDMQDDESKEKLRIKRKSLEDKLVEMYVKVLPFGPEDVEILCNSPTKLGNENSDITKRKPDVLIEEDAQLKSKYSPVKSAKKSASIVSKKDQGREKEDNSLKRNTSANSSSKFQKINRKDQYRDSERNNNSQTQSKTKIQTGMIKAEEDSGEDKISSSSGKAKEHHDSIRVDESSSSENEGKYQDDNNVSVKEEPIDEENVTNIATPKKCKVKVEDLSPDLAQLFCSEEFVEPSDGDSPNQSLTTTKASTSASVVKTQQTVQEAGPPCNKNSPKIIKTRSYDPTNPNANKTKPKCNHKSKGERKTNGDEVRAGQRRHRRRSADFAELLTSDEQMKVSSSKSHQFEIGDIVWGHVYGHPWWPAKVLKVNVKQIEEDGVTKRTPEVLVSWYGSTTASEMNAEKLEPFLSNFQKAYIKKRKSRTYQVAIQEAQDEYLAKHKLKT